MLKTQDLNESQLRNRAVARMILNSFDSVFVFDEEKVHRQYPEWGTNRASWATMNHHRNLFNNEKNDARARIENAFNTAQELFLPSYWHVVPNFMMFVNESKKQLNEIANLRMKFTNELINGIRPKINEIDHEFQTQHKELERELQKGLSDLRMKIQKEITEKELALKEKSDKLDSKIQSLQGMFQ